MLGINLMVSEYTLLDGELNIVVHDLKSDNENGYTIIYHPIRCGEHIEIVTIENGKELMKELVVNYVVWGDDFSVLLCYCYDRLNEELMEKYEF